MQITGRITAKRYRCTRCGAESTESTNHYGDFYPMRPRCCGWKHPLEAATFECLEPLPEGWARPEPWRKVRLGDLVKVG